MASFNNLSIENFRGFDKIELRDFNQVNILLGNNNSGKSSILEALFLLIGMNNPSLPSSINGIRGLKPTDRNGFLKSIFHNLDVSVHPVIIGDYNIQSNRRLEITPLWSAIPGGITKIASSTMQELEGIKLIGLQQDGIGKDDSSEARLIIENGKEQLLETKSLSKDGVSGTFISSIEDGDWVISELAELVKRKKENRILTELQKFDRRINAITVLPDNVYFDMEGVNELMPMNLMGDGMRRFLTILSVIANSNKHIVLIDEIENGLHYSANKLLWQSILSLSKEVEAQLFITTHNLETLQCLNAVLEDEENMPYHEKVNLYTIARTKLKGFQSYRYGYDAFSVAISNEVELRN